ncbi:MAG TPA: hypothetical protein VGH28_01615 [Polyangiaceae bacterium]|jgi:hypothetical protein
MDQHDEEIWLVQLQNGAVRAMTLDELDAAYQDGSIDEETFVRRDGASKWAKLRDELGGDEPAAPAPVPVPSATPSPVSYGAVPAYAPQLQAQQALYSTRPVVSEIDTDELDMSPFKKSRKGTYAAIAGVAVLAIGAMAFGASRMGASASPDAVGASVANAAQPPPQVTPPPPPTDTPSPASTLSEEQKKQLADLDKTHEKNWESKRKARDSYHAPAAWHPSHTPFHKGGNKYDPLNAKL